MSENSKFLVEIIFTQPFMKTDEEGQKSYDTKITTQIYSFEGSNRSATHQDAKSFMDKVIRHGLELKGGSVLKSIIHPSCILQVGLIDEVLYQKEMMEGLEETKVDLSDSSVSPPVPAEAESAPTTSVDLNVAG